MVPRDRGQRLPRAPAAGAHHDFAFFPVGVVAVALANLLFIVGLVLAARVFVATHGEAAALRGATLLAFAPPAFVFSLAYSEALFLVSAAGFFLVTATARTRPLLVGAAVLTRITGAGLVVAAAAAAAWRRGAAARPSDLLAGATGIVALGLWWACIAALTSDPLGFLHGALGWQPSSGPAAVFRAIRTLDPLGLLGYGFALAVLGASVALFRHDRPQAVFALGTVALGLLFGRESSVARYALAAFPAFGMLGRWSSGRGGRWGFGVILAVFVVGQGLLVAAAFAQGSASQPP